MDSSNLLSPFFRFLVVFIIYFSMPLLDVVILVGTCEPVYCSPDNCYQVKTLACIAIIGWFCVYVLVNCYLMKNVCIAINNGGVHVLVNCYLTKNVCISINNGGVHVLVNCYLTKNVCISINNDGNCYRTKNVRIAISILCRRVC